MITEEAKKAALTDIQNISADELVQVLEAVGCIRKIPKSEPMEYVDFSNINGKILNVQNDYVIIKSMDIAA